MPFKEKAWDHNIVLKSENQEMLLGLRILHTIIVNFNILEQDQDMYIHNQCSE